ncbi:anthrone oxygenase family protein [Saccharopolyspora sp. NPDC050389]|uniref:anthrone oxygenase family protein n=1 Tax=Saccharopolyspora sp. NPDC050389 TaxID=3155516 RepID=UPI0033F9BD0E
MKLLQTTTLLSATMACGLMAGLFAGFAYAVMPGLGRSSDRTLVEAMQNINKAILNPAFLVPFIGAIPLIALAVILAWRGQGRPALPWLIAGLVLYLVAFAITRAVNVPLNGQLATATSDLAAARGAFEKTWVTWNIIRALVHTAAFVCLLWALIVYGAHRPDDDQPTALHAGHEHSMVVPGR